MAIVQYSGLITQIRGKLGGSVLSKFNGGFSMYRKANPSKFGSDTQQQVRSYFSAFAGTWRTLTGSQRNDWNFVALNTPLYNRLGELRPISGFAYFIKYNQFLRDAGQGIVADVAVDLAPAYALSLAVSNFSASPGLARFQIDTLDIQLTTISNSADANTAIIYASLPKAYTDFKYFQSWYRVAFLNLPANLGVAAVQNFQLVGIEMPKGWRVFDLGDIAFRCEVVNKSSAQFSASTLAYDSVVVVPPTIFPRLLCPAAIEDECSPNKFQGEMYWLIYWNRQNPQSNPNLFEIQLSAAFSNVTLEQANTLNYGAMFTQPILGPTQQLPHYFTVTTVQTDPLNAGPALLAALGGNFPVQAIGYFVYLRTRTRLLTGGPWSSYQYQAFSYSD